eukprot:9466481-Pyramimonas_sp.AAC.1
MSSARSAAVKGRLDALLMLAIASSVTTVSSSVRNQFRMQVAQQGEVEELWMFGLTFTSHRPSQAAGDMAPAGPSPPPGLGRGGGRKVTFAEDDTH